MPETSPWPLIWRFASAGSLRWFIAMAAKRALFSAGSHELQSGVFFPGQRIKADTDSGGVLDGIRDVSSSQTYALDVLSNSQSTAIADTGPDTL